MSDLEESQKKLNGDFMSEDSIRETLRTMDQKNKNKESSKTIPKSDGEPR